MELLNTLKLTKRRHNAKNNRLDFPEHYGATFGITRARFSGKIGLSKLTLQSPKVWEWLQTLPVPIEWNAIQINKNLVCPPHKDKNNIGNSYILSFGDYMGGELVIEGIEHDTRTGLVFNGFEKEHWNKPITGIKYSVIFFKCKYYEGCYPQLPTI
jgi:hypothetical protein